MVCMESPAVDFKVGVLQEDFIDMSSIPNQKFTYTGDYYLLHNFDLDRYDRKFAIIDYRLDLHHLATSKTFTEDFERRVNLLKSQGFVFIRDSKSFSICKSITFTFIIRWVFLHLGKLTA